ncbi:prolipoprotein diacylglyceryl transferase family protein [Roseateles chitinivorans]|uniref:prolipoprotein diacylglyceryl transferase family protein n=1 Tax=Roseateles chitinivorans TaxID=2917965 RepID=UPI003D66AA8E
MSAPRPGSWPPPRMTILGRRVSSFQVCGAVGLVVATTLVSVLTWHLRLPLWIVPCLLASGLATAFVLAMATKVLTGQETLVFYHHEIAILATSALLLQALGAPVLRVLDLNALWLGAFLVFGRQGCLMVGCCHGRPHHWGVRYSESHAGEGFPACYVGVRLFPVQGLESLLVAAIVVAGSAIAWRGAPAGSVLALHGVSYCAVRIGLEELRGDAARPYWGRFSEAQWTSAVLMAAVRAGEWQGRLPRADWHFGVGLATAIGLAVLALTGRARHRILAPRHADEVARLLQALARSPHGPIAVRRTSQAFGVSCQALGSVDGRPSTLYALSHAGRALDDREARVLSGLIANLVGARGARALLRGARGIFHLIVRDTPR